MRELTPQRAQEILDRDRNKLKGWALKYFEAVASDTLPDYYLERFIWMRDSCSDELPDIDVRSLIDRKIVKEKDWNGRMTRYKCQGNYVYGLILDLNGFMSHKFGQDPEVQSQVQEFLDSDLEFTIGDPKNQERIDRINTVLDVVITYLSPQP